MFNGPQIRELMNDSTFDKTLNKLKSVSTEFLGNKCSQSYKELVSMLMQTFKLWAQECQLKCIF